MPRITRLLGRRAGPVGLALTVYDVWRRLPEKQRKRLIEETRTRGPKIAAEAVKRGKAQIKNRSR